MNATCHTAPHKPHRVLGTLLCLVLLASPASARQAATNDDAIAQAARASLPQWLEFLRLPNVAARSSAEIARNAEWARDAFAGHGFQAQLLAADDAPMVFAQWPHPAPQRKTVLFYAHMDGQAVFPQQWSQRDPFTPVLKQRDADGGWRELPLQRLLQAGAPDPEWRVFARSAADDKAPIVMLLAAMDSLRAQGREPAINVKVILDSREESGSPSLAQVVARNRALLQADAVVMLDGPMHRSNRPTLVFGHRGGTGLLLTVYGAREELHSGHYGNYAPNPAFALARLLAGMKDAQGRVLIPGFYDGVAPDRAVLAAVPDDAGEIRGRIGIAAAEQVGANYQEAMNYPTLNINAMSAGAIDSRRTVIPASAAASLDLRTVPGTPPPQRQVELVRAYVQAQGYHLVEGEPTPEQRARYPLLASIHAGAGGEALQTPLDAPIGQWAQAAVRAGSGQEPVRIPLMGGGVPSQPLAEGLGAPILLVPLVNADNNQHVADENMRIGNYLEGVRTLHALLSQPLP
ncbi:M20/M25/M40 family metallo-hydrolase [Stenotrophomonas sp. MMGLT7]|uniref:M20/M25/M40 family metallo-hydrolase n=1 Tax=Stenotrophomonas sp. MMGLT7 TaxID=2901227 RepID=UPI001E48AADE|nr:M20/M25/M40 family metallo-hydrolase [Stenotrophomonas sp. MMGLT7]MCD7097245.1 M20/M25/M40 family metallo-hydrolase [Stenotrophomonas sp. MMGLT7]